MSAHQISACRLRTRFLSALSEGHAIPLLISVSVTLLSQTAICAYYRTLEGGTLLKYRAVRVCSLGCPKFSSLQLEMVEEVADRIAFACFSPTPNSMHAAFTENSRLPFGSDKDLFGWKDYEVKWGPHKAESAEHA
jgi:hypothetical protein